MSISFAIAIYVIIWWTVLFAVLPIGVRTQAEDGTIVPGTPASAPTRPRLLRVALLTTVISALVFAALWFAVRSGLIDLERWLGRPSMSDLAPRSLPSAPR
jgi:predicted secreted protein